MDTRKSNFDNEQRLDEYNLEVFAYVKENKGDFKGAIKDLSIAIEYRREDYYLFFRRGIIFFKMKKYKEAINDFSKYVKSESGASYYALFLRECCKLILHNEITPLETFEYLSCDLIQNTTPGNCCIAFLNALERSLEGDFEKSLNYLIEIKNIDRNFLREETFCLLDHLPKEMKPLLNLCWEMI